jgi:hypothetical protein
VQRGNLLHGSRVHQELKEGLKAPWGIQKGCASWLAQPVHLQQQQWQQQWSAYSSLSRGAPQQGCSNGAISLEGPICGCVPVA